MTKLRTILVACALSAGVAACDSPALLAPDAPRFDGVHAIGGGDLAASADSTGTLPGTGAERGGPFTVGSGN